MIPARRLFHLLWGWLVIGLAAAFFPSLAALWLTCGGLIVLLAGYDLWALLRQPAVQVERHVAGTLALGVWSTVRLHIQHACNRA